jgi:hypothetical protein
MRADALNAIGNTPLVSIPFNNMNGGRIFAKLEYLNGTDTKHCFKLSLLAIILAQHAPKFG